MADEHAIILPDARTLAFTDIGAEHGRVVVYHHGAPGGRLELVALDAAFAAAGVRVITPDRPGYGRSTAQPVRTTADFTADTAALVDHLGVDRFGVMGLSSGGPYAVACAALLGARVLGAVVAAGNTDMTWPSAADGYLPSELRLMSLDDPDEAVRLAEDLYGADGAAFFDDAWDLGTSDSAWLADAANASALSTAMTEAFRQGVDAYARDIWVQGRAWTFDPAAITRPVIVAHGADDRLVPISHSCHTAALVPGAELRVLDGVGHLGLVDELPALAAEITRR